MRDPYEFINFFKQSVQMEVLDSYTDFMDDIKCLKETHIMIKGHERESGKNYMNRAKKFMKEVVQLDVVKRAFLNYPD